MLDKVSDVLSGGILSAVQDGVESKVSEYVDVKVKAPKLVKKISNELQRMYGTELFYNDFTKYVIKKDIINDSIQMFWGENGSNIKSKERFIDDNFTAFITEFNVQRIENTKIKEAFSYIYDTIYAEIVKINPHSDAGKLQIEINSGRDEIHAQFESVKKLIMECLPNYSQSFAATEKNHSLTEDIDETSERISCFLNKIDEVGTEKNPVTDDKDAIKKYIALLAEVSIALRGETTQQIEKVICSINCHIALRYSNLGEFEKALKKLEEIDVSVVKESKIYHYVYAVIIVSHRIIEKMDEAIKSIDRALELDPSYHRAKMVKSHLKAIKKEMSIENILAELDTHFASVISVNETKELTAEYYVSRAFIYKEFGDNKNAIDNHFKAKECGYDRAACDYNMCISYYEMATENVPKNKRIFTMNVDKNELIKVINILKPWVVDGAVLSDYLKAKMVAIYVSACAILGIKHNLKPIHDYIDLPNLNYEIIRLIILNSDQKITEKEIGVLESEDVLIAEILNKINENDYEGAKELFSSVDDDIKMSESIIYMFLQVCVLCEDVATYWKYRRLTSEGIDADFLEYLDAYAYEKCGGIKKAKTIINKHSTTSTDYQMLCNLSLFYARNGFDNEREKLLLRLLKLKNSESIYIDDLSYFYGQAIEFLTIIKSEKAELFVDALADDCVDNIQLLQIKANYFNEISDVMRLTECVSEIYDRFPNYKNGRNKVICLIKLMRYTEAVEIAKTLYENLPEEKLKERAEIIWLISDIYLLLDEPDESYEWARIAHETFIDNPSHPSHQGYMARSTRTGHMEALTETLKYRKTHPVITGTWMKEIKISDKDDNIVQTLHEAIAEFSDESPDDYQKRENEIARLYRTGIVSNSLLLKYYNDDLSNFFIFASKNGISIASGNIETLQKEQDLISDDIFVDFMSLVILQKYGCLEALKQIKNIHICFATITRLQHHVVTMNAGYVCNVLKWIKESDNIIFEVGGFPKTSKIDGYLSDELLTCINAATRKNIPILTSEFLINQLKTLKENIVPKQVKTVTIPALCNVTFQSQQGKLAKMLYNLLSDCKFISFGARTILNIIEANDYIISETMLSRFFSCRSSYDMMSFARVYFGVLTQLSKKHPQAGKDFMMLVLEDALKVWKRGTYYRYILKEINVEDKESLYRANAIGHYLLAIRDIVKIIYEEIPSEMQALYESVNEIAVSINNKKI